MRVEIRYQAVAGVLLALVLGLPVSTAAQISVVSSFDPPELDALCSIAVSLQGGDLFVYGCFNDDIHRFSPAGTLLATFPHPGETANDVDVQIAPEALVIGGISVPAGTLLFINGETSVAEIYAMSPTTGGVLASIGTDLGNGSVVGGAYSPLRDTFFLVTYSDDVIAEINPSTGETLNSFDVTEQLDIFYGDLEVSSVTGNLFVVSNTTAGIFEFTPDGLFVGSSDVPAGVGDLSGIALSCGRNEAWVSERSGTIHRLGQVPCGTGSGGNEILVTEPEDVEALAGRDVPLQAVLPSGFSSTLRDVCYRRTGEAEYSCEPMQPDGGVFGGSIPSSFVTARGVQYYYWFSDGVTVTTVPEFDPEGSPFTLDVLVNSLRAGGAFSPGTYRMVSVPVDLLDDSFDGVLDTYGPADSRRWRLLRWNPTLETYDEYPALEGGFSPCEAYWLITFDGDSFETGSGRSVSPSEPCVVTVRPGWNQFGSPYAFPVAWSDVAYDGLLDGPVLYDASTTRSDPYVYDVDVLEPWQGYWVFNPGSQDIVMSFRPIEATAPSRKRGAIRRLAGDEYELRLRATLPEHDLADLENHLGFSVRASDGFDTLDLAEAPPIGDHVRLSILENDRRLAGSFRPAGGDGQKWDIRITGQLEGAPATGLVRVAIDEFGALPEGFDLRIVDLDAERPVRIDPDGFEVELTPQHPVRNLRVIVGTDAFAEQAGESISELPRHSELARNYPNPFSSSTTIRYQLHVDGPVEIAVFDPLGRRVRTLVSENSEPGWYETVWNGRDESGTSASSGLYFYVLRTTAGSVSRTMVLLR